MAWSTTVEGSPLELFFSVRIQPLLFVVDSILKKVETSRSLTALPQTLNPKP